MDTKEKKFIVGMLIFNVLMIIAFVYLVNEISLMYKL